MGGSPKPQQQLAGETSLLGGDPESNRGSPGPLTSREMAQSAGNFNETSTLDIELGQGPVTTKVQSTLE